MSDPILELISSAFLRLYALTDRVTAMEQRMEASAAGRMAANDVRPRIQVSQTGTPPALVRIK